MFTLRKVLAACALLLATGLPTAVFAFDETLTFRLNAQGEIEAIVTGLTRGFGCNGQGASVEFDPPSSIAVSGNEILIVSVYKGGLCSIPRDPQVYQQVANLGYLEGSTYHIVWNEGSPLPIRFLEATLNTSDPYSVTAPALSPWGLCMLLLSMAGVSLFALHRRVSR
ncbi:MAG: hypothetical protein QM741_16410 [Rudaea sp.]|uniref:hypothetical protein n=1 Tax=Rudaea sp. TaxID=2136325 RepID=UPI0039E3EDD2